MRPILSRIPSVAFAPAEAAPHPTPGSVVRGRPLPGGEGFPVETPCRSFIAFRSLSFHSVPFFPLPGCPAWRDPNSRAIAGGRGRVGAGAVRAPDCPRPRLRAGKPGAGRSSPVRPVGAFSRRCEAERHPDCRLRSTGPNLAIACRNVKSKCRKLSLLFSFPPQQPFCPRAKIGSRRVGGPAGCAAGLGGGNRYRRGMPGGGPAADRR